MPRAFFGRYRLMAIDGTVFNTPETKATTLAFGRSNQQGPGAYPQVRCVLLAECGSHAVVVPSMGRYDVSEVHGAHRLLEQIGPDMLVLMDAGITSGGFVEHVRERRAHALGTLEAGVWEHLSYQRRLADGSVLAWVGPTHPGSAHYPVRRGMWVRIISYRVTDERVARGGQGVSCRDDPAQSAAGSGARTDRLEPFDPDDQFLDFVDLLDPLASELPLGDP